MITPRPSVYLRPRRSILLWLGLVGAGLVALAPSVFEWALTEAAETTRCPPAQLAPGSTPWAPDRNGVPRIVFVGEPWSATHRALRTDPVIRLRRGWGTDAPFSALCLDVADGRVFCGGRPVGLDRIAAVLDQAHKQDIHWVYIDARPENTLGSVMQVVGACRQTRMEGIALNGVLPRWAF